MPNNTRRKKSKVEATISQSFAETADRVTKAHEGVMRIDQDTQKSSENNKSKDGVGRICPIDRIVVRDNIRKSVPNDVPYRQLKASITKVGLVQPLVCRLESDGALVLIAGHRRLKALEELGIEEAPVVIRAIDEESGVYAQLSENMCRSDVELVDVAEAMLELFSSGYSRKELESVFERDRMYVSRCLKIAKWPTEIKDFIRANKLSTREVMSVAAKSLSTEEVHNALLKKGTPETKKVPEQITQKAKAYLESRGMKIYGKVKMSGDKTIRCSVEISVEEL